MAVKFAETDPDGNGERDSYAFASWTNFMPIFGAFGILEGRNYYIKDGKAYTTNTSSEYKQTLEYLNKLWNAKAIDPDFSIMQTDQYRQKLAQGKIGLVTDWWSLVPDVLMNRLGFKELNPDGVWTIIQPSPKGPGGPFGDNGMLSSGEYQNATWLSTNTKHPVEAIKFLDYLISDEGYELTWYGLQGIHYTSLDDLNPRTPEGQTAYDEK